MNNTRIGTCEYCQTENVPVVDTPEVGIYCAGCHRLVVANSQRALREIREFEKLSGVHSKKSRESQEELDRKMNEAFANLTGTLEREVSE